MANYVGQIRIYSLVDLWLLLAAVGADIREAVGVAALWIGFLLFLESGHSHEYRERFPKFSWLPLWVLGVVAIPKPESIAFIFFAWLYTQKNKSYLATISPIFRGLQTLMIVGEIAGYCHPLILVAPVLTSFRNLLGDWRDCGKDLKEKKITIPCLLGMKSARHVHLLGLFLTSSVWWWYSTTHISILILVLSIQIVSYNLTPR